MTVCPALLLAASLAGAAQFGVETRTGPQALPPLVELGLLARQLPAMPAGQLQAASLDALLARAKNQVAAAGSVATLNPAAVPQAAALLQAQAAATSRALLTSAGKILAGYSARDIQKLSPEAAQKLAASLLGETRSAAVSAAAVEQAATSEPKDTIGLMQLLRSRTKTAVFLASMGPGYDKIDPSVFALEARALYAVSPGKPGALTLAQLRERTANRTAALIISVEGVLGRAKLLGRQNFEDLAALAHSRDPHQAIAAALRLREALAALPPTPRRKEALAALDKILDAQRRLKALADLPLLTAEGVTRSRLFVPTQEQVRQAQRDWDTDLSGQPIADIVVVGAGPAGLATAIHAAASGVKTVVLEAGYLAQSFADAAMKPIYRMRTPATRNSLVQAPFSPGELLAAVGMLTRLKVFRARGQLADEALFKATGLPTLGGERENLGPEDSTVPSARNELLQHFAEIAAGFVDRGGLLREQNPVRKVSKRADGLWAVESEDGSVQLARNLVLAQGQVGVDTEHANFGQDLDLIAKEFPEHFLTLRDRRDLSRKSAALHGLTSGLKRGGKNGRRLIVHDALLGTPDVERSLQLLPRGTRVAVVGSGESAVKAVMAVLRQNPGLSVDLFTQGEFTANQLQVPAKHVDPDFIREAIADPKTAEDCVKEWQAFGVPVTPATIADLKQQAAQGRLTIHPLGRKVIFGLPGRNDEKATVVVRLVRGKGRYFLTLADAENPSRLLAAIDGPIVTAIGYSRRSLRQDPLTRQLLEQGRIAFKKVPGKALENEIILDSKSPFSSAQDPDLYIIGAQNYGISADSTIPGTVARAAMTVAHIRLKMDASVTKTPPPPAVLTRGGAGRGRALLGRLARWLGIAD